MKTNMINTYSVIKSICVVIVLLGMNVNAWGAADDVHTLIDFTATGNLGHSSYTDNWAIAANANSSGNVACTVHFATSNNVAYICFGGKPDGVDSYLGTTTATTYPAKKFTTKVLKLSNKSHLTINSVKLFVYGSYSEGEYSNKIDEVTFTDDYAVGTVNVTPTSGTTWPSGSYFVLVVNLTNTNTTENDYTSIEYMKLTEGAPTFTVTYNDNGKDGGGAAPTDASSPYDPSSTVTVLGNTNSMTRTGYTFNGWNTKADGSGTNFAAGATFTITKDTTLYAKWALNSHTLAVASVDNVVISSTTPSVAEGSNTSVNYGTTITLSHGDPDGVRQWGGWNVYKTGDPSTTVSVDGNNQFTMPDYNVTVSANLYSDFRFSCAELTLTPKLVTASTPIFITSAASKTVRSQDSIQIVGSGLTPSQALEFPNLPSKFSIKSRANGELSTKADGTIDTVAYIFYTPGSGDTSDGIDKLTGIKVKVGGTKPFTQSLDQVIIGRHVATDFVIAAKYNDKWWALPATMSSATGDGSTPTPVEIAVDDKDNPSIAYTVSSNKYGLAGPTSSNITASKGQYVRLTMKPLLDGTDGKGPAPLYSSSGSGIGKNGVAAATSDLSAGFWWALTQANTSITNVQDAKYIIKSPSYSNSIRAWFNATGGPKWGQYNSGVDTLRLIHASSTPPAEAEIVEWGQHKAIVEVDAQTISATQVIAKLGEAETGLLTLSQTLTSVNESATKYDYTVNFGDGIDFAAAASNGALLVLEWYNSSNEMVGVSNILVPKIIASSATMSSIASGDTPWSKWEVHVLPGVTLTANAGDFSSKDVIIKQLEIYPGATVKVTKGSQDAGTLDVKTLILRNGWTRLGEKSFGVSQLHVPTTTTLKHTTAYADWYVDFDRWYPIAVPWPVTVSNICYKNKTTGSVAANNIRLQYYDGASRANGGTSSANWKKYGADGNLTIPTQLVPAQGYAMTAQRPSGKAFSIIRMPLTFADAWTTSGEQGTVEIESTTYRKDTVHVVAHGKGATPAKPWYAVGWNFIANPYMAAFNGNNSAITGKVVAENGGTVKYATILDMSSDDYDQIVLNDDNNVVGLKPQCGFFVQVANTGYLEFLQDKIIAPSSPARYTNETPSLPEQEAYIRLSGEESHDRMGLIIGQDYTADYEVNADLSKILGEVNSLRTWMRFAETDMAYLAVNEQLARELIPVAVRIPQAGEYTYSLSNSSSVSELEGIYLMDYQTGCVTNLINESYTFQAEAGIDNNRFAINAVVGHREVPTEVDALGNGADATQAVKFIYHEKVYVLHNGVIYDATGKRVTKINK